MKKLLKWVKGKHINSFLDAIADRPESVICQDYNIPYTYKILTVNEIGEDMKSLGFTPEQTLKLYNAINCGAVRRLKIVFDFEEEVKNEAK